MQYFPTKSICQEVKGDRTGRTCEGFEEVGRGKGSEIEKGESKYNDGKCFFFK
jgi:hypothetical protein